ncbi:uncharacterized protein J4E78_009657 [Alternaria triticimaculans]|uniref:uncharacterized protein n=1 Tax=Alternaria triticimaculans TaxID=297637 RepID=UPI0020C4D384|nr:uncharacterized protein J4E78_009657 [Alternaria triticimaculans]KAI4644074.1 hypothetical protein J4E78_009657 [Alternaria triticimaculans]
MRILRIFEKICGERHFQDVVVVTTMWNSLKTKEAQDAAMMREKMMGERPEFFGNMMRNGARMERYQGDTYSGIRIVELLADRRGTITLQLQREMGRDVATKLEDTTAGRYIDGELANAREKYETQKRELEECAEDTGDDDDLKSEYVEQAEDCTRMVKNITADQESLSVTLEDMRNEQVAWCSKGHDDHAEDAMHENTSTRIFELEHKVQDLERVIQEQRVESLNAQREGIEKIEAGKQDIDQAKERDQIARDKAKQKRAPPSEVIVWMRDFFAGRRTTEYAPPPRRADSMPIETKPTKKTDNQVWKIGSRPKGRHSGRPNIKRTSSDDHPREPYADSQYLQYQQTCEPEYLSDAESGLESEREGSAPPMYTPHNPHSYTPVAPPDDIIIAVMGITGCGKTTFVNLFSDRKLEVGHGLDSCTVSVQVVPCTFEDGTKVYLVDTPGFDDTYRSDSEILREVALWLNKAHTEKLRLAGIIFLQRISDVRVGGSGIKNIKMFQKLCGDGPLSSVVLATTMWDMASPNAAIDRERELKEQPQLWKRMIDHGSCVFRHDKGKSSALKIIKYLMKRKKPVTLDIQREMVDQNLELVDTGAGGALASSVETLIKHYEKKLKELEQDLKEARAQSNKEDREILEAAQKQYQDNLAKQQQEMQNLQVSAAQLIEDTKKRFEESEVSARENMLRAQANHAAELEKQRVVLQRQFKEKYLQMMHERACNVM